MSGKVIYQQLRNYVFIICLVISVAGCRASSQTTTTKSANAPKPEAAVAEQTVPTRPERSISLQTSAKTSTPKNQPKQDTKETIAPTEIDIEASIARAYQDAVLLDKSSSPQFVTGDFNADGSEDIAVVVTPVEGKIADINSEFANWTLQSPKKLGATVMTPVVRVSPRAPLPEKVGKGERLLAIIHGVGPNGWRNPDAKQTYLLRNVAGNQLKQISVGEFMKSVRDKDAISKKSGDVISDTVGKETGYIFWNGSRYAWYQ